MAGTSLDFDPVAFRADIRGAMIMGLPEDPAKRPTFHFDPNVVHEVADAGGDPFDWTAPLPAPADGDPGPRVPVQVPCAWETFSGTEEYTDMGSFNLDEALLTILDVDYALVVGFDHVLLDGNTYHYTKELPARGLFEVTVHQILVTARDES